MAGPGLSTRFRGVALAFVASGLVMLPALVLTGGFFGEAPLARNAPGAGAAEANLLGASGVLPRDEGVSDGVLAAIERSGARQGIPASGPLRIPPVALDGYRRAEEVLAVRQPGCGVRWPLLAGLGQVISEHATGAGLDRNGDTRSPILGPTLDGSPGLARVPDADGGRLDLDDEWDRATGPMQIIPTVWQRVGSDSDGDGTANPHNVYDAALAAGRYLCERDGDLRSAEGELDAVFRYQRSETFVRAVLAWSHVYGSRGVPDPTVIPGQEDLRELAPPRSVPLPEQPAPPGPPPRGPERAPVSMLSGTASSPSSRNPVGGTTPTPVGRTAPPSSSRPGTSQSPTAPSSPMASSSPEPSSSQPSTEPGPSSSPEPSPEPSTEPEPSTGPSVPATPETSEFTTPEASSAATPSGT